MRTYTEMARLSSLEARFDYLVLSAGVGESTFGFERHVNQSFYHSREWRDVRREVIVRDDGCDLGVPGFPIRGAPRIHHMNPLEMEDFEIGSDNLLDPEYLITVSLRTHNAIHFGDQSQLPRELIERRPGDTRLW